MIMLYSTRCQRTHGALIKFVSAFYFTPVALLLSLVVYYKARVLLSRVYKKGA